MFTPVTYREGVEEGIGLSRPDPFDQDPHTELLEFQWLEGERGWPKLGGDSVLEAIHGKIPLGHNLSPSLGRDDS